MQRVRVGMTGLAAVVLLIAVVSAMFSSANREAPVSAVGAPNAMVVANLAGTDNADAEKIRDEPLAELGVAPSAEMPSPEEVAREQAHQKDTAAR